jgi:hypothetical protein
MEILLPKSPQYWEYSGNTDIATTPGSRHSDFLISFRYAVAFEGPIL